MKPISLASAEKSRPTMTSGFWPLLLLVLLGGQDALAEGAEAFIKVTRFQVPQRVRLGERVHLACYYELGGETLHAMKLFKDDNEFYRFTPAANHEEPAQRLAFSLPGVQVELQQSNERDVWLKPATKSTGGTYKCQVIVENTFKSLSVERQLEVRNRSLGPVVMDQQQQQPQQSLGGQHPRQRHAVQTKHQARQHQSAGSSEANLGGQEPASAAATATKWHLQPLLLLLLLSNALLLALVVC